MLVKVALPLILAFIMFSLGLGLRGRGRRLGLGGGALASLPRCRDGRDITVLTLICGFT